MMNSINIISHIRKKGFSTSISIAFRKMKLWSRRACVVIFDLFFGKERKAALADINNQWKCYSFLLHKYKKFLFQLPEYECSGNRKNIIWWCWLQGEEYAPRICKACLASVKKCYYDYEVIVITSDNYQKYAKLPDFIRNKYDRGIISNAHFSDILRTVLLIEHGGVWIDSTVLCTSRDESIINMPFFLFRNWKQQEMYPSECSNWFIVSNKSNPVLMTVRDLLFQYWMEHDYCLHYFIYHFFFKMAVQRYADLWEKVPNYPNTGPHILQFESITEFDVNRFSQICSLSNFHKLTKDLEEKDKSKYSYIKYILEIYHLNVQN